MERLGTPEIEDSTRGRAERVAWVREREKEEETERERNGRDAGLSRGASGISEGGDS